MMNAKWMPLGLAVLCVTLSALAQVAMKWGMSGASRSGWGQTYGHALWSPWVWLGLCLYGLSAVLWLWVLSRLEVGVAYPMVSLGFVLTTLLGVWWLGEAWTWAKFGGCTLILAGVYWLAHDMG